MRQGVAGIELKRGLERVDRSPVFAARQLHPPQREERIGLLIVQCHGALGQPERLVQMTLVCRTFKIDAFEHHRIGQPGIGFREVGRARDGLEHQVLTASLTPAGEPIDLGGP